MSIRYLLLLSLLIISACVPKPEQITGCGEGKEFNELVKNCVTDSPIITPDSTLTTLSVVEDVATSFSLPNATTEAVGGDLFWFIVAAPIEGTLTNCADRTVTGAANGTGTTLRNCIYTPDTDFVGNDSFSYKICNTSNGASRCGSTYTVSVTVSEDNLDHPLLISTNSVNVLEGSNISVDIRASRKSVSETNSIYVCMSVVDPAGAFGEALTSEAATKTFNPSGTLTLNDPTNCTLVADEADDLTLRVATFSATAAYLSCPLDDCSEDADLVVMMCQQADCSTDPLAVSKTIPITVTARNFTPTFSVPSPTVLASIAEGSPAITIGTAGGNDRVLPTVTDADGDAVTYEFIPISFYPPTAGTLSCIDGSDLACTFTPSADFNGTMTFRYFAEDSKSAASTIMTANITVTSVNDPPIFITGTQIYGYVATPVSLSESTTLANRTFKVGEGGSGFENSQVLTLLASSSDNSILPPGNIELKRGGTTLGTLSSVTPLTLDSSVMDADAQNYTLSFTPVSGVVTATPVTITLTLNDGSATDTLVFNFSEVVNVDNAPQVTLAPATALAYQLGGADKTLTLRATPGSNDWDNVSGGLQSLTITVTSSSSTVADASAMSLTEGSAGISISTGACSATSCVYTVSYDGSNDPQDDDLTLTIPPGVRGMSTLTITYSDGTVANNQTSTTVVNVYNFVASFGGWSNIKAIGNIYGYFAGLQSEPTLTLGWNSLVVTENGTPTTAYTVNVYRNSVNNFVTLPTEVNAAPVAFNTNEITLSGGASLNDGADLLPGVRAYYTLAVVPTLLGEELQLNTSADNVVEIVMPPDNMTLVHRWMANKEFCEATGSTADRNNNYRCINLGLGAVFDAGSYYFDQMNHVFVDKYENGCPFDQTEDTLTLLAASYAGQVHYERLTGVCRYSNGVSWVDYSTAGLITATNTGQLAPLVSLTRTAAQNLCNSQAIRCDGAACADLTMGTARRLPLRREAISISAWPVTWPVGLTQGGVEDSGNNLAFSSCNNFDASTLSFVNIGSLTNYWQSTFPASFSSTNRMLINDALYTSNCESRYGVRNYVGNVAEWLLDSLSCSAGVYPDLTCNLQSPLLAAVIDDSLPANNSLGISYAFNNTARHGPLLNYAFSQIFENYLDDGTDRFHMAMGLPYKYDVLISGTLKGLPTHTVPATPPDFVDGGLFSYDTLEASYISDTSSAATTYAMVQGGDWNDQGGVGRYRLLIKQDGDPTTDVGFRCIVPQTPVP